MTSWTVHIRNGAMPVLVPERFSLGGLLMRAHELPRDTLVEFMTLAKPQRLAVSMKPEV